MFIIKIVFFSKCLIYIIIYLKGYLGALRLEKLHTNIHITLLCPGPVFTNFLKESFTGRPGEVIWMKIKFMNCLLHC